MELSNVRLSEASVNGKLEVFKKTFSAGFASISCLTSTHLRAKNHLDFSLGRKPSRKHFLETLPNQPATPKYYYQVEVNGLEPMTPCVQSRCSPN